MSLLPTCREMSRLLSEARDGGRPIGWHMRVHLGICAVCRRALAQFGILGAMVKKSPADGPGLSAEAKDRLRRALRG